MRRVSKSPRTFMQFQRRIKFFHISLFSLAVSTFLVLLIVLEVIYPTVIPVVFRKSGSKELSTTGSLSSDLASFSNNQDEDENVWIYISRTVSCQNREIPEGEWAPSLLRLLRTFPGSHYCITLILLIGSIHRILCSLALLLDPEARHGKYSNFLRIVFLSNEIFFNISVLVFIICYLGSKETGRSLVCSMALWTSFVCYLFKNSTIVYWHQNTLSSSIPRLFLTVLTIGVSLQFIRSTITGIEQNYCDVYTRPFFAGCELSTIVLFFATDVLDLVQNRKKFLLVKIRKGEEALRRSQKLGSGLVKITVNDVD